MSGAVPLGALLAGYLGETIGLLGTLTVSALGLLCMLIWVLFSPLPRLRTLPEPAEPAGSAELAYRPALETVETGGQGGPYGERRSTENRRLVERRRR